MQCQYTLGREIPFSGIGLHSGKPVQICFKPAPADTGLVFVRTDMPEKPHIPAKAENVTTTLRATTISTALAKVFTIEHLMAALNVLGIDNCYIEIDGEEPPVADGCAAAFFTALKKAGKVQQKAKAKSLVIDKIYRMEDGEKFIVALPYDGFRISFTSLNENPFIGVQYADFLITEEIFGKELAAARTIAYEKEIIKLQEMGLGLGGSLENVIVYTDDHWLNPLRYSNELVRHKILDLLGDLRLAGNHIKGHFIAVKSGHALNTRLAKELVQCYR